MDNSHPLIMDAEFNAGRLIIEQQQDLVSSIIITDGYDVGA
jgi:hypothetical protein